MKIFSSIFFALLFEITISSFVYPMEERVNKSTEFKTSGESASVENLALENFMTKYGTTDLNNVPYELKLHIAQFLQVDFKDIGVLVKKIYQLSQITQEWRNVVSIPDIWRMVFSKFFEKILIVKAFKNIKDIKEINRKLTEFETIIASIKSAMVIKSLNQNIIYAMTNVFFSIVKEVKLNLELHEILTSDMELRFTFKSCLSRAKEKDFIVVGHPNIWDNLLLIVAASKNFFNIVAILLSKNCDINCKTRYFNTPLIVAAHRDHKEIVKLLLRCNSIQIDAKNNYGCTALINACRNGNKELVEMLLRNGADVNIHDKRGRTPLMYGLCNSRLAVIKKLLEHSFACGKKINLDAQDKTGETALLYAIYGIVKVADNEITRKILGLLLSYNADVNIKDAAGNTALRLAVNFGDEEIVKMLISNAIKRNSDIDSLEWLYLNFEAVLGELDRKLDVIAIKYSKEDKRIMLEILTKEFFAKDQLVLNNLLIKAILNRHSNLVDLLIKNGAKVNDKKNVIFSAFHSNLLKLEFTSNFIFFFFIYYIILLEIYL